MSSFFRRLFGRSRLESSSRPANAPLPAAPDPDDLFDWSPRAKPEAVRVQPIAPEEADRSEARPVPDGVPVAPISEALSQFQRPGTDSPSTRPPSVPERGPAGPPSMPPPPPPPGPSAVKPAQIRLLMGDGTVVEVAGDPELEHRLGYLAENLLAPRPAPEPQSVPEEARAEPDLELPSTGPHDYVPDDSVPAGSEELNDLVSALRWPQMRLVFADGSEAALPPDQEIVDRLAYVIANLLPGRPAT